MRPNFDWFPSLEIKIVEKTNQDKGLGISAAAGRIGRWKKGESRRRRLFLIFLSVRICSPSPLPPDQRNDHGGDKPYSEQSSPDRQRHEAEKAEQDRHSDRAPKIDAHEQTRLGRRDRTVAAKRTRDRAADQQRHCRPDREQKDQSQRDA